MDIKERYWKFKQAFRKRRQTIGRIISAVLLITLLVLVVIAAINIKKSDDRIKELANIEKNPTTIKAVKNYDYGEPGFNKVAENDKLILDADFTTGEIRVTEKASGKEWYSNPKDKDEDKVVTMKNRLASQFYVKFVNPEAGITVEFDNVGNSIKKGTMTHEKIENGVKFTFGFTTANVYIPVQYTLTEDGFQAEIVTSEIKGVGSNPFMIDHVALLPYFGAGGLEDEGYLFVPDGSGALINFNNNKQDMAIYNAPVYGKNPTLVTTKQDTVKETIRLPIFGAKVNDHAFLAVITAGDANSTISASTSMKANSYNYVHANAVLTDYNMKVLKGDQNAGKTTTTIDFRENQTEGKNYCVRYFFLEGENANYTGMSNCYRDYLVKNNLLKDSALADKKYMVIDLIGAVSIQKYVMGVKRPVVTALTTYNDVVTIVKELKEQGVENLIINYIGAMDSGLNNQMFDKVKPESALGSKKDFKNMVSYLEEQGVQLFLEMNPVDLYEDGNGYTANKDSVKTYFEAYAFQYKYFLDTAAYNSTSRWHLLQPVMACDLIEKFTSTFEKWNVKNLSLDRVGNVLYSDYTEDTSKYISRDSVMNLYRETLQKVNASTEYLMLHGGNVYSVGYADVITDTSDGHSGFDMQDQSIPFYQLTFQDNTLLTAAGINTTVDYEYAFLKALETGANLKYNLIYGNVSDLVGTDYNTMVSYSYDYWKGVAAEQYKEMQSAVSQLAGKEIVFHEYLTQDVTLTKYESATVIVNYGAQPYDYNGQQIASMDYLIVSGGAK